MANTTESVINYKPGEARIKTQFLVLNHKPELNEEYVSKKDINALSTSNVSEDSLEPQRKKLKGQNKHRPREKRMPKCEKLCTAFLNGESCIYGEECCFSHDIEKYVSQKPKDIGEFCYMFEQYGKCRFSFACRFSTKHYVDGKNVINEDLWQAFKDKQFVTNNLTKDLQKMLRKKTYNFEKSETVLESLHKNKNAVPHKEMSKEHEPVALNPDDTNSSKCDVDNNSPSNSLDQTTLSSKDLCIDNICINERKKIDFSDKLYLAPLTTVGNLPFRRICKEFGADITCGEMAMATSLLQGHQSEWALLKRHYTEDIFGVQICGNNADVMTRCAQLLSDTTAIDFIDINMGCPLDPVFKKGAGCGLMYRTKKLEEIINGISSVTDIPLTLKMRAGLYSKDNMAHNVIHNVHKWDDKVKLITVHGRSREQRYTKSADWNYINECSEVSNPIPLFGSGDVLSYEDYNLHREKTKVSGIMIARGALIKPWIFKEIKDQNHWDISSTERYDLLKKYVNYGLEHWGSDTEGVERTRRFLLEWLSFLYRYIPVGLLESIPQRINERPPLYHGRNDLETLMSSACCADWVKISEMLLGPVPENFIFLPKHKANAYQ